jgi:hypothetical protein
MLRQQTAAPDVTVTESKELLDPRLGAKREVDVVVEGPFDGEPVVTSIEVIEHNRRASITWVEQQINKHRTLPTNRLVLVSKSGFTKNGLKAAALEGGWVQTMSPKMVKTDDGREIVQSIFADQVQLTPSLCRLIVQHPEQGRLTVRALADNIIYDAEGRELGFAVELAREFVNIKGIVDTFLQSAHNHPERDELKGFSVVSAIGGMNYCLRDDATGLAHPILAIEVEGSFAFQQSELAFATADLGGRRYASGQGVIFGRPGVWVATPGTESGTTTISWRLTDNKPLFDPPPPSNPPKFADLARLNDRRTGLIDTVENSST